MVLLEPTLAKLASAHGGCVHLVTRSGHAPLISLMPGVRMEPRGWLRRFDRVCCFDHLDKSAIHALLVFSPQKELLLRSPTEITALQRFAFDEIRAPGLQHQYLAEYNWDYTPVDTALAYRPPKLAVPPDSWRPAGFALQDYLLLNPTAGWKSKRWKSSSWIKVLQRLLDSGLKHALITSGGQDWQIEHSRRIAEGLGDRVTFLGGQTKLPEFLWLVSRARMVLGVDGAASHLSAAFGGHSLTLFFRTNPLHWHKRSPRCVAVHANLVAATDSYDLEIDEVAEPALALWLKANECATDVPSR